MILPRKISCKGEASGKPFHPLKTYPSRMLRPPADYSYPKDAVHSERSLRLVLPALCNGVSSSNTTIHPQIILSDAQRRYQLIQPGIDNVCE